MKRYYRETLAPYVIVDPVTDTIDHSETLPGAREVARDILADGEEPSLKAKPVGIFKLVLVEELYPS